ncbi:MAG: translocation/assembly module TamB domain-containing protein, partial [Polymorphobacter sp.]
DRFGLGLVRIFNPALDLSGSVSGSIDFNYPAAAQLPTARAELRVNGLSRAGIGTASTRIDIGINALLANGRASTRMTIAREGRIEGRAQAQLAVIPGSRADPLLTRLFAAPVFAQLRWAGPAQALWPLAGVDRLDVRGPIVVAIDGSGVLGDPRFAGTVTAKGARIESTGIGLVLDRIAMESRFTGSRLELTSFSAGAGRDGTISASGGIDLSAVRNFPMDFALDMRNAMLINRDDLRGAATGTVRIRSGADGARISGNLDIDQARITLGSASVADVPALVVTEINGAAAKRPVARPAKPTIWQLDLGVEADNRLMVRGMGLDSEWSADVRVTGSIEAPRVTGKVALVRGDYDFAGKRFTLTRGDVRFTGNYPPDPIISITAENTSSNFTATLKITGTAQRPMISFSSIPALPEDEVLSRVLFGESITNLSAPEAIQLAGALATLRGGNGGLNPINAIRKGLGIDRLRILPADTTRGRKTSIAAGQYIGDRVYVEVTSDAQGFSSTSVEVSLTRSLSILSEIATLGGTSLNVRWKRDY